jgi:spoIIIJ-associated protein
MDREARPEKHNAEFSGKTVEDALESASDALGVPVNVLQYQVMRDSTRSFLGFVRTGEVTIRVTWDDTAPKPTSVAPAAVKAEPKVEQAEEPIVEPERESVPPHLEENEEGHPARSLDGNPPQMEPVALEILTTLLDKMGALAAVEVMDRGGQVDEASGEVSPLILNVVGDDLAVLIGRRGETLRSLQFMTRLIVSRRLGVWPNLVVDVESYKVRREESLRALALRVADQVRQSHQPVALEPMPAHERRIVHLALRDNPNVYTESTGKEDRRKVQILPK